MIRREFAKRAAGILAALGLGGTAKASRILDTPKVEFEHLGSEVVAVAIGPDGIPEFEVVGVKGRFHGMIETLPWEDCMRFVREAILLLPGGDTREGRFYLRATHDIRGYPDKDLDYSIIEAAVLVKAGDARRFRAAYPGSAVQ